MPTPVDATDVINMGQSGQLIFQGRNLMVSVDRNPPPSNNMPVGIGVPSATGVIPQMGGTGVPQERNNYG
eukprot:4721803-Ditylum_brightwellii.AAC.1